MTRTMNILGAALLVLAIPAGAQAVGRKAESLIGWTDEGDVVVDPFAFTHGEEHADIPREELAPYPIPHPFAYRGDERAHRHTYKHQHWHTHRLEDGTLIHHRMPHNHSYWHYEADGTQQLRETRVEAPGP